MSFNKVILIGNFTKNPELRQSQSGTSICRFSLAMNRSNMNKDGSVKNEVCFVDVEAFGKAAENISKYFSKGKMILVEGRLRQENWEDRQSGQKRSKLVVVLERFEFIGAKAEDSNSGDDFAKEEGLSGAFESDDVPF